MYVPQEYKRRPVPYFKFWSIHFEDRGGSSSQKIESANPAQLS